MALKMDRDVKRVTVVKSGSRPGQSFSRASVYRSHADNDEPQIERVTVIKRDETGRVISHDSYESERKGKRRSREFKSSERGVRAFMEFQGRVVDNYLARHDRSNDRRRDGWLSDMPMNVLRAVRKSKPKKLLKIFR